MTRLLARTALLMLALSAGAQAQADDPPLVPLALVQSMPIMFGDQMHFSVGRAPATWPPRLVPGAPATLIGGMTMGPIVTLVLEYPHHDEGRTSALAMFKRAGFVKKDYVDASGGFGATGLPSADTYCSESGSAVIMVPDTLATSRKVVLLYLPAEARSSACSPSQYVPQGMPDAITIPSLRAPAGARVIPAGTSSSADNTEMTAYVDTTFDASTLLTHYGKQLAIAGWTVGAKPVIGDGVTMLQLSARDTHGVQWWGFLSIVSAPPNREIVIRMSRPTPRF